MAWYDWVTGKGELEAVGKAYNKITGSPDASQRRAQQDQINQQMKAYKEQSEITRDELNAKRNEVASEKRRVEEKQIRNLRRNYRAPSFLGGQDSAQPGMTDNLGG